MIYSDAKCFSCGSEDNLNILTRYKNGKTQYTCRPCNRVRTKSYYDKRKVQAFNHYGNQCSCCGESIALFLSIDHIDNDGHKHRWANGDRITGVHLYQKLVKANFPEGYQTLCMNCNFGKRMNGGICPHQTEVLL